MKCPYCNKELGEKNDCVTSWCYAFKKVFPRYDTEENNIPKENTSVKNNISVETSDSTKNTNKKHVDENIQKDTPTKDSNNTAIYIMLGIVAVLIIGYVFL
ncbi:hypothetical protein UT300005_15720 [Clostridium sp. CTA-5]